MNILDTDSIETIVLDLPDISILDGIELLSEEEQRKRRIEFYGYDLGFKAPFKSFNNIEEKVTDDN